MMKTVVYLIGFEMPKCCGECTFEGLPYPPDSILPEGVDPTIEIPVTDTTSEIASTIKHAMEEYSLPYIDDLPFCILTNESIYDDTVKAPHCWLKEGKLEI